MNKNTTLRDVNERLRELYRLGIDLEYHEKWGSAESKIPLLICVYADDSREFVERDPTKGARKSPGNSSLMIKILKDEGIDTEPFKKGTGRKGKRVRLENHWIVTPNKGAYRFLLPSREYLESKSD